MGFEIVSKSDLHELFSKYLTFDVNRKYTMIIKHDIALVRNRNSKNVSILHLRICQIQDVDQMMLLDYNIRSVEKTNDYVKR